MDKNNDLKFYTIPELCEILKVSHRTVQTYLLKGKLKGKKVGGKWIVTHANLIEYINESQH